jgi:hypothetical protein
LKNKLYSFEELQDEARLLLNSIIEKHSVAQQEQVNRSVAYIISFFLTDVYLYLD